MFKCEKDQDRLKWVKALNYLQKEALKQSKPLEFEK